MGKMASFLNGSAFQIRKTENIQPVVSLVKFEPNILESDQRLNSLLSNGSGAPG